MENLEKGRGNCSFKLTYAILVNKLTFEHFCLKNDVEIIGRSSSSLVTMTDLDVSRIQCLISNEFEGLCTLLPQGLSDTLVNGKICARNKRIILKNGDVIGISRHHFTFSYIPLPIQKPMDITDDDTIKKRSSLFELTQNEEAEEFNAFHMHSRSGRDEIVCDLSAQKLEQLLNNNGNSKEEKDVLIKELKNTLDMCNKKEEEWLKDKEEMEKRFDEQKKEFEEQLKSKKLKAKKLIELKNSNKHLKVGVELSQNRKTQLVKKNDDLKEELDLKKRRVSNMINSAKCEICSELYAEPVLLNCGHIFCKFCVSKRKEKKECPMCRTEIQTEIRNFSCDGVIDKLVQYLPEEEQKKRENLVKNREGESSRASSSERASVEETMRFYTNMLGTPIRPSTSRIRNPLYWFEPGTANLIRGEEPHQGTSADNSSPTLTHVNTSLSTVVSTPVIDLTTGFLD